jgi:hypothetical protein
MIESPVQPPCPGCGWPLLAGDTRCPHCAAVLDPGPQPPSAPDPRSLARAGNEQRRRPESALRRFCLLLAGTMAVPLVVAAFGRHGGPDFGLGLAVLLAVLELTTVLAFPAVFAPRAPRAWAMAMAVPLAVGTVAMVVGDGVGAMVVFPVALALPRFGVLPAALKLQRHVEHDASRGEPSA